MDIYGKLEIINLEGEVVYVNNCFNSEISFYKNLLVLPQGPYMIRFLSPIGCEIKKYIKW